MTDSFVFIRNLLADADIYKKIMFIFIDIKHVFVYNNKHYEQKIKFLNFNISSSAKVCFYTIIISVKRLNTLLIIITFGGYV